MLIAIPMPLLIGLNALRVLGVLFLLLAVTGRLSGPFPYSAGLGDIITGVFAIPLALSVARSQKLPVGAIVRWNISWAAMFQVPVSGMRSCRTCRLASNQSLTYPAPRCVLPFCMAAIGPSRRAIGHRSIGVFLSKTSADVAPTGASVVVAPAAEQPGRRNGLWRRRSTAKPMPL